jgi:hypothetical protein
MAVFVKAKCPKSVLHHGPRRVDAHLHDVRVQVGKNASLNIIWQQLTYFNNYFTSIAISINISVNLLTCVAFSFRDQA